MGFLKSVGVRRGMSTVAVVTVIAILITGIPYLVYSVLYLTLRPRGSPATKDTRESTVSIILPTYNEADIITRKLDELCSLDYPNEKLEIVVIDASEDETATEVEAFFADRETPTVTLVREPQRQGAAAAFNEGIDVATGDVLFRTDADSTLADDVIRIAVANLADPEVGAVTGRQSAVVGGSIVEQDYRDLLSRVQVLESRLDSTFIFHGPCGAFDKTHIKPVPEDVIADDTAAAIAIRRTGHRVIVDPDMQFSKSGASGLRRRRQRKDRRAMGLVQVLTRNLDAIGRYGTYGRVVLPSNLWFLLISPWLVFLDAILLSVAAVALVGLVGLAVPLALITFVGLGARELLGPLQPIHAVVDSQLSLCLAHLKLLRSDADGTWAVDRESREVFE